MQVKLLELRDKATFIPIFAFRCRPHWGLVPPEDNDKIALQQYLLGRAGFGPRGDSPCVIMGRLECSAPTRSCAHDPYSWSDRTFATAHQYITEHFDELNDGDVIDVEFILGETKTKKMSEQYAF